MDSDIIGRNQADSFRKLRVIIWTKKHYNFSTFSAYHENSVGCANKKELHFQDPSENKTLSIVTLNKKLGQKL